MRGPPGNLPFSAPVLPAVAIGPSVVGMASWYRRGPRLVRTCTGEPLLNDRLSAASPVLPMGTRVRVTRLDGDRSVVVRVNDCMPRGRRMIDLSEEAARELGLLQCGVALVRITPVAFR
jgi:rare lipoprotein A